MVVFSNQNMVDERVIRPLTKNGSYRNKSISELTTASKRRPLGEITNSTPSILANKAIKSKSRALSSTRKKLQLKFYPTQSHPSPVINHNVVETRLKSHSQHPQPSGNRRGEKNMDDAEPGTHHRPVLSDITSAVLSGAIRRPYCRDHSNTSGSENVLLETETENEDVEYAYGALHYTTPLPKYDPEFDFDVATLIHNSRTIGGIPAYEHLPLNYEPFDDSGFNELDDLLTLDDSEENVPLETGTKTADVENACYSGLNEKLDDFFFQGCSVDLDDLLNI